MKTLHKGTLKRDIPLRGSCGNCGCVVETEPDDEVKEEDGGYGRTDRKYVDCPTSGCLHRIYVSVER